MQTYCMHASMLDDQSTDEQRAHLCERLGDARIRHNPSAGVLIACFPIQGEDSDEACLAGAQLLRSALRASDLSPTILMVGTAAAP